MIGWHRTGACIALLSGLFISIIGTQANASPAPTKALTIQLKWYPQSQFAGYYVANDLGFFKEHDLSISLLPGSTVSNPITSLFNGKADVAQAAMSQAISGSVDGHRAVNIAQIFQGSDSELICLKTDTISSADNLNRAKIAVSEDNRGIVKAILRNITRSQTNTASFVERLPDLDNLLNGSADCIWGSEFNEYWKSKEAGLPIFVVKPNDQRVSSIEDGLYVDESRLSDPQFREQLVGLFLGLRKGWEHAKSSPATSVQLVLQENPTLDYISQRRQLELVLALITDDFGYFDPAKFQRVDSLGLLIPNATLEGKLWTHRIYDAAAAEEEGFSNASRAIREQLERTRATSWYLGLILLALFSYAISASIIGLKLGYRLWGQIVLAGLIALGGGVIRDLLVARQRFPVPFTINPIDLYVTGAGVLFTAGIARIARKEKTLQQLDSVAKWADAIGFSILSVNGAAIATVANLPLVWVPICSALTVAGGGLLLDVVVRREHHQFRHEIYEEISIVGALVLAGAFTLASVLEKPILVPASFILMTVLLTLVRFYIVSRNIYYPVRRLGIAGQLYKDSQVH